MKLPNTLAAFEAAARERMSLADWDYLMNGMGPGQSGAANVEAWARLRLRPRVLRGVAAANTATTLLGASIAAPMFIAPNGRATRYHPDGEASVLRAASEHSVGALLASSVGTSIRALSALQPDALVWSQVYMTRDRALMRQRVAMAADAGSRALVLTVDLVPNATHPQVRKPTPAAWETPASEEPLPMYAAAGLDDLGWLCSESTLPVVVKGLLRADDATACVEVGAKGIIVSNHGGNQLDGVVATADALPEIVGAVGERAEIYVDGGVRSGLDVLKALALGARAVMIGRPMSHGLAVAGSHGVSACLTLMRSELERAMLLCGACSLNELTADLLA